MTTAKIARGEIEDSRLSQGREKKSGNDRAIRPKERDNAKQNFNQESGERQEKRGGKNLK